MTIFGKGTRTADRHVRRMIAAAVGLCLLVVTLQPMGVGAAPLRSVATLAGDIPLSGDWDGNGTTTIGVFRAGTWFLRNSNSPGGVDVTFSWGAPGDIPVTGDWDGNGTTTIGVFRAGTWFLRNSNSGGGIDVTLIWGAAGDTPLTGDWDNDGVTTPGLRRGDVFQLRSNNNPLSLAPDTVFSWGLGSDVAVSGDWDGSGTTTIGVFRAGTWFLRNTNSTGGVDVAVGWGAATDVPLTGDWDGNNTTTLGVRRVATFFERNSVTPGGVDATIPWGLATVVVIPALSLQGRGLGTASFGANFDEVIGRISARLGPPTSDLIAECDGGLTRAVGWPGLAAYGQGGSFIGYAHRSGSGPLRTPEGLGLGDPLGTVAMLYGGYVFFNGSLGPEFIATASDGGTYHGFATTPTGTIFLLGAGFLCVAR